MIPTGRFAPPMTSSTSALMEAVYRSEVEKVAAAERKFSDAMPPVEALRAWMLALGSCMKVHAVRFGERFIRW